MRESEIERKACDLCEKHHVLHYKFVSPQRRGVPDRILVFPNWRVAFAELKAPDGRLSKLQEHEQKKLTDQGAEVQTFYSFEAFSEWFHNRLGLTR